MADACCELPPIKAAEPTRRNKCAGVGNDTGVCFVGHARRGRLWERPEVRRDGLPESRAEMGAPGSI